MKVWLYIENFNVCKSTLNMDYMKIASCVKSCDEEYNPINKQLTHVFLPEIGDGFVFITYIIYGVKGYKSSMMI